MQTEKQILLRSTLVSCYEAAYLCLLDLVFRAFSFACRDDNHQN